MQLRSSRSEYMIQAGDWGISMQDRNEGFPVSGSTPEMIFRLNKRDLRAISLKGIPKEVTS